ncbi:MAG: hypothetical protein IPL11_02310 [Candidatus Accumulibacter sp.]|nr:hypothetical protein [Accumulibacter sp.]
MATPPGEVTADVELARQWLQRRFGAALWLWGLRTGCLLANEAANRMALPVNLLFWQPVLAGKQFLQQFLRLEDGHQTSATRPRVGWNVRGQLRQGESVEVAGYLLSPAPAGGLEKAELQPPHPLRPGGMDRDLRQARRQPVAGSPGAPQCGRLPASWARSTVINGPAFWQTPEISECPVPLRKQSPGVVRNGPGMNIVGGSTAVYLRRRSGAGIIAVPAQFVAASTAVGSANPAQAGREHPPDWRMPP